MLHKVLSSSCINMPPFNCLLVMLMNPDCSDAVSLLLDVKTSLQVCIRILTCFPVSTISDHNDECRDKINEKLLGTNMFLNKYMNRRFGVCRKVPNSPGKRSINDARIN